MSLNEAIAMYKGKKYIRKIASLVDEGINSKDKYGFTALMLASLGRYTEIAQALIASDADINTKDTK